MSRQSPEESHTGKMFLDLDKQERKRHQNRVAQRTWRRNQKLRIQALEAAVAQSAEAALITPHHTPPESTGVHMEMPVAAFTPAFGPDSQCEAQSEWAVDPLCREPLAGSISSEQSRSALQIAIQKRDVSMAGLLLERGADIDRQDQNGGTALHLAAELGCEDVVEMLLHRSANPNKADFMGRTPLFSAVQSGNENVVKLLIDHSADVNMRDSLGEVALHLAVETGSEAITLLLLSNGANINA
ncbi:ankyrin repeat-containing domain protein [Xylariales sp. PMI_506]|nr:ankyrin repeat-containing domain protein [Xylariales sp. PMI_506]